MAHKLALAPAAAELRRRLGPVAWCALEAIASHVCDDGERADVSVRTLAAELGVAPNTAHRALRRLVQAGLVEPRQMRAGHGRFGAGTYRVTLPRDVLRIPQPMERSAPPVQQPKSPRPRQLAPAVEQLALLPSG